MSEMVERVREAIRLALHDVEEDVCVHEMTVAELDGIARALLAERLKEREACVSFVENGVKRGTSITDWRPTEVAKAIRSRP